MEKDRIFALSYINEHKSGYVDDLKDAIGEKFVEEFSFMPFITYDFTKDKKTWKINHLGEIYAKDMLGF